MWPTSRFSRPWLQAYPPGVPHQIDVPRAPLTRILDDAAERHPRRTALLFFGRRTRYARLRDEVDRFADGLRRLGVRPGDRVALILPNCPQLVVAFFAVLRLGAVAVPHNPLSTRDEMRHQLSDCGAETAIVLDRVYDTVRAVRPHVPLKFVVIASLSDALPWFKRLALRLPTSRSNRLRAELSTEVRPDRGLVDYRRLFTSARPGPAWPRCDPEHDLAAIQYTGGTEGRPKGVMLTHRNLLANAYQAHVWDFDARDGAEVTLAVLPMFHSFGLTMCLTVPMLSASAIVLLPKFDAHLMAKAVRSHRPTVFPGVPPLFERLMEVPYLRKRHLASLRLCVSGAMPLNRSTVERFRRRSPGLLVQGYGLTEAAPGVICNPLDGNSRHVTVGVPIPSTDALVVDENDPTRPLPPGQAGELVIRGPQVFPGYWNRPAETSKVLSNGWMRTGDIAVMSPDGFFTIIERQRDVIKVSGFSVFPVEVEEILCRHPAVMEAAVFGLPDDRCGERVAACVVVHPSYPFSADEMRRHCAKYLTHYKVPHDVHPREDLPRSIIGKVLRQALRTEYARDHVAGRPE